MTWKATADRVVVQVIEPAKQTESGIVLPEKTKEPVKQGIVLAVGGDVGTILPGDRVFFEAKFATGVGGGIVSVQGVDVLAGVRDE